MSKSKDVTFEFGPQIFVVEGIGSKPAEYEMAKKPTIGGMDQQTVISSDSSVKVTFSAPNDNKNNDVVASFKRKTACKVALSHDQDDKWPKEMSWVIAPKLNVTAYDESGKSHIVPWEGLWLGFDGDRCWLSSPNTTKSADYTLGPIVLEDEVYQRIPVKDDDKRKLHLVIGTKDKKTFTVRGEIALIKV